MAVASIYFRTTPPCPIQNLWTKIQALVPLMVVKSSPKTPKTSLKLYRLLGTYTMMPPSHSSLSPPPACTKPQLRRRSNRAVPEPNANHAPTPKPPAPHPHPKPTPHNPPLPTPPHSASLKNPKNPSHRQANPHHQHQPHPSPIHPRPRPRIRHLRRPTTSRPRHRRRRHSARRTRFHAARIPCTTGG